VLLALAGCGGGGDGGGGGGGGGSNLALPDWPAPPNPMELTRKAGRVPERAEFLQYHVHAHLDVLVDGQQVTVPAGIGIDTSNPAVVSDDQGVGLLRECEEPCISPLHTHAEDGILHTETKTPQPNTLGQFFTEWGVRLTGNCVGEFCRPKVPISIYGNGDEYGGDPNQIELSDRKEIAIVIGSAPDEIPSEFP